jgi:hypothetical protein
MGTEPQMRGSEVQEAVGWVERYRRRARWFHAAVYITVLLLLATGWWLLLGQEGNPSLFARLTGIPDTSLHKMVGWGFVGVAFGGIALLGWKATATFVRESDPCTLVDASIPGWPNVCGPPGSSTGNDEHRPDAATRHESCGGEG